jgi:hypothetical protein
MEPERIMRQIAVLSRLAALALSAGLFVCLATPAIAQGRFSDIYSVQGVAVDVKAENVFDARDAAIREAGRRAWVRLWSKLVDEKFIPRRPNLSDADLRVMVASVDVQSERASAKRYIASMTVTFDPLEVRRVLERVGALFASVRSRPMLLLPLLRTGGAEFVYELHSPWAQAWARFPFERSLIDYIRIVGSPADRLLLTSFQARNRDPVRLQMALNRYRAEDVALMSADLRRQFPGGPILGVFRAYRGASPTPIDTLRLTAPTENDLPAMLDQAVVRLDMMLTNALRAELTAAPQATGPIAQVRELGGYQVLVATPDAAAWERTLEQLRRTEGMRSVFLTSLAVGGISRARLAFDGDLALLAYALDQVGIRLDSTPDGYLVRERRAEDAPIPRPEPVATPPDATGVSNGGSPAPASGATPPAPAPPKAAAPSDAPTPLLPPTPSARP